MVSYTDIPHHTEGWELESHHYKRTFIGKLDRLRISLHGHHKRRLRVLGGVHEVLDELHQELKDEWHHLNHAVGQWRTDLKNLPLIPYPASWGTPKYQPGQRVRLDDGLTGIVCGLFYSDMEERCPGWHYVVKYQSPSTNTQPFATYPEKTVYAFGEILPNVIILSD
jgi:hypothetical protein